MVEQSLTQEPSTSVVVINSVAPVVAPEPWACGVTTIPGRVKTLLPQTLQSLHKAGFPAPWIFMDGACDIGQLDNYGGLVIRHPGGGHLANWYLAMTTLYTSFPKAERYAIFEDDLLCCPNLRSYLDSCPYPAPGYLNLLTHDCNLVLTGPVHGWHKSNQRGKGAVALVFDREAAQALLSCREFINRPADRKRKCADGVVCDSLIPQGYTEWVHYPSLVQHVGVESSLGHEYGLVGGFRSGYDPLASSGIRAAQEAGGAS